MDFEWQSKSGVWTREALARESLTLYFMPAAYSEDRIRSPKGPQSATLAFENHGCQVYGYVSFQTIDSKRFDTLLKVANATRWVGGPTTDQELSWPTWKLQLRQAMGAGLQNK
ncbi:hypothetical protein ABE85_25705 (plasmid) [Mitsuaria sp. 7]|nr:hypothetical protein ABE85_25705 [Mitsuaria sp. 7]